MFVSLDTLHISPDSTDKFILHLHSMHTLHWAQFFNNQNLRDP